MLSLGQFHVPNHRWPKGRQRLVSHFPENILRIPKTLGKCSVDWRDKKETFLNIWCKTIATFQKNIISTVKHEGGSVMVWGHIRTWMESWILFFTRKILKKNIRPSEAQERLGSGRWSKTKQPCKRLTASHRKPLTAVVAATGGTTSN